jgi:hypothetical protein
MARIPFEGPRFAAPPKNNIPYEGPRFNEPSPRGQPVPQTVEELQKIMAADAVVMEKMGRENARLKSEIRSLKIRLARARNKEK